MGISPFRASVIKKASTKHFSGKSSEKLDLAKKAGSTGFSKSKMSNELKGLGYKPRKRKEIMDNILGVKKQEGPTKEQIRLRVRRGRMGEIHGYEDEKGGGFINKKNLAEKKAFGLKRGASAADIGIKRGTTGFASSYKSTGPSTPTSPKSSPLSRPNIPLSR